MKKQRKTVEKSYDKGIKYGKKGIDFYQNLPEEITSNAVYPAWQKAESDGMSGSERKEIKEYLHPKNDMKFVDLGCCLNLMFKGYDGWASLYYGVDVSRKTIRLLKKFVKDNQLSIGSLFCGSAHKTPFEIDFSTSGRVSEF